MDPHSIAAGSDDESRRITPQRMVAGSDVSHSNVIRSSQNLLQGPSDRRGRGTGCVYIITSSARFRFNYRHTVVIGSMRIVLRNIAGNITYIIIGFGSGSGSQS